MNQDKDGKKGIIGGLLDKLDKSLKDKSKRKSCCSCDGDSDAKGCCG